MFVVSLGLFLWLGWSVPVIPQTEPGSETIAPQILKDEYESPQLKVHLNQATIEDLQELPGIGPVLAQRILWQREQLGPFLFLEELLAVKGVGSKRLERLRPFIHLEGPEPIAPRLSLLPWDVREGRWLAS